MYMYPVITTNTATSELSPNNTNSATSTTTTTTNMPRNRSLSATTSPPPALISRGFASLRRAHRRLSNSSPSSAVAGENINITTNNSTPTTTAPALGVITDEELLARSSENSNNTTTRPSADSSEASTVRPRIRLVPNVGLSSRSFVFEIIDRVLEPGVIYRIGRFSDRNALSERLSFKSKVVSRSHAEFWTEQGKVYIRDTASSSGTFLNRIRLSPPSHVSAPHEVRDGDAIQLGVDYQGGMEPIYRAVRIRVEINRQSQNANSPFARTAFQQLRSHLIGTSTHVNSQPTVGSPPSSDLLVQPVDLGLHREPTKVHEHSGDIVPPDSPKQLPLSDMMSRHNMTDMSRADIQECCICLYAITPFQALFIAPCSHIFHFKCLRPIVFQNYPGFSCPLCRSYFDLEASVAVEVDEVLEAISAAKEQQKQQQQHIHQSPMSPIDTVPELNEEEEEEEEDNHLDKTAENSIHPSSNHSERSDNDKDEVEQEEGRSDEHIKNRLGSTPSTTYVTTPPVPYVSVPDDEEESSSRSPAQAIAMNDSQHLQAHPRTNRNGEALLSTTLVGSPIFEENVLPAQNDDRNVVS